MKNLLKVCFCLSFLSLLYVGWSQWREEKKRYLKKETYFKHLKKDVFLSKLARPIPNWMEDQLQEDFQDFEDKGIGKDQIDATFAQIQTVLPTPFIIRYRILNNELYRYFRPGELITLEDISTELAIKTLLQCTSLPNVDFIISFYDGIRPNHIFFHTPMKEQQAPLLISAKIRGTPYAVLVPDFRSIGHWWISDIKHVKSRMDQFPWDKKKEFAIWRGTCNREERLNLCRLSILYPQYLDAKFNLPMDNPQLEKEGLMGETVPWESFLECKYLPYVDGYMTAAPALQWRLLSNSVTFKPETDEIQWFSRVLEPYVHYVPLKTDLSDLIEKFDWAKLHDSECRQIAYESTQFALNNLMYEDVLLYLHAVLNRYASLQKIDFSEVEGEMGADSRWVNIQYRKNLLKEAKRHQMSGYLSGAEPGACIISSSKTSPVP